MTECSVNCLSTQNNNNKFILDGGLCGRCLRKPSDASCVGAPSLASTAPQGAVIQFSMHTHVKEKDTSSIGMSIHPSKGGTVWMKGPRSLKADLNLEGSLQTGVISVFRSPTASRSSSSSSALDALLRKGFLLAWSLSGNQSLSTRAGSQTQTHVCGSLPTQNMLFLVKFLSTTFPFLVPLSCPLPTTTTDYFKPLSFSAHVQSVDASPAIWHLFFWARKVKKITASLRRVLKAESLLTNVNTLRPLTATTVPHILFNGSLPYYL